MMMTTHAIQSSAQATTLYAPPAGTVALWIRDPDEVAALAEHDAQRGAGRRRYAYAAPAGWRGLVDVNGPTVWLSDDASRGPARISVWPALRIDDAATLVHELLADQRGGFDVHGPFPLRVREDLAGDLWEITAIHEDGSRRTCVLAILRDGHRLYPFRLDTQPDQRARDMADLLEVLASVRPLAGA